MMRHPPTFEIVRRALVREDVDKKLSGRFQGARYFGEEEFVVFHVFEEFDRDDAVVCRGGEFMVYDVSCDDGEIGQGFGRGDAVDVGLLRARVGEGGYLGVRKDFGEEEGGGAPAAAIMNC